MKVLDPRGRLRRTRVPLAPRPSRAVLAAGRIVFHDNQKMDVGEQPHLLGRIQERLAARALAGFVLHRESVRGKGAAELHELALRLRATGAAAAVLALGDMGVSPAMVTLAIALEELGMPAVLLTAGPGSRLCIAHAAYRAGALSLVPLALYPGSTRADIEREADVAAIAIEAMLTSNGAELAALCAIDYPVDKADAAADGMLAFEQFDALHIGDGLPCIPPTLERYAAMRRYCPFDPAEVVMEDLGPSGTPMTVREILVAGVMAGCKPEDVPILLTAMRALSRPQYNLFQAVTTSFGGGHFVLASGPMTRETGLHSGQGCLGPGFRANATIGRAVSLALSNVLRSVPGFADLACLSSPAEYSYCMAEGSPPHAWRALHQERFGPRATCVMALEAESPHSIMDLASSNAESLLDTIVDCCTTLGSNNAHMAGTLVLVLNPDHARMLAEGGYDKEKLRGALHGRVRVARNLLRSRGLVGLGMEGDSGNEFHHVTRSPADVEVIVAGGGGGHSAVILPWALQSEAVYEAVRLPDGSIAERLEQFAAPTPKTG